MVCWEELYYFPFVCGKPPRHDQPADAQAQCLIMHVGIVGMPLFRLDLEMVRNRTALTNSTDEMLRGYRNAGPLAVALHCHKSPLLVLRRSRITGMTWLNLADQVCLSLTFPFEPQPPSLSIRHGNLVWCPVCMLSELPLSLDQRPLLSLA